MDPALPYRMQTWPLYLILVLALYVNFRTPAPDVDPFHCRPIVPWSHLMLAPRDDPQQARTPSAARRGLFRLQPRDRARCWALFRIVVDVFRFAPEQRDSLERVLRVYSIKRTPRAGRGPCTPPKTGRTIDPTGER
jgi:hypothetical protein